MAKITELPAVNALIGDEFLPIVQGGATKRVTMTALRALITPFLQYWYKGDPGDPGPAGNVAITIGQLRSAPRTNGTMLAAYDGTGASMTWSTGDFSARAAQRPADFVKSDFAPLTEGAWVRASADMIPFDGRSVSAKLSDTVSVKDARFAGGAKGDGVTDDTAAFESAAASGLDIFVPATAAFYRTVRTIYSGRIAQRFYGGGRIVCEGKNDQSTCLALVHAECVVEGLRFSPGTDTNSLFLGWGVACFAPRCRVTGVRVTRHRRGGVMVKDADHCIVSDCIFSDSVVLGDGTVPQSQMGYDVYVGGTASRTIVRGNECSSGAGVGIGCQNAELGKSQFGNIIDGNVIRGHPCYGIMLYLNAPGVGTPQDRVDDCIIVNNLVSDISGSAYTDGATLFYGAGIYIQTSDNFTCSGNRVLRTNTDRSKPRSGSDVPAAIAISGFCRGSAVGNVIDDCHFGIAVITGSFALPAADGTVISDNQIDGARAHGIYLASANSASVTGNRINAAAGNAGKGIFVLQAATYPMGPFQFVGNYINGFAVGIESNTTTGASVGSILVQANKIRDFTTYGVYAKADEADIQNNSIGSGSGSGIVIGSTVDRGLVSGNVVYTPAGNALEDSGVATTVKDNEFTAGGFIGYPAQLPADATPNVRGRRYVRSARTTPLTGFSGGREGQTIILTAESTFTIQNGSDLILRGGVDRQMTAGQAIQLVFSSPRWREI